MKQRKEGRKKKEQDGISGGGEEEEEEHTEEEEKHGTSCVVSNQTSTLSLDFFKTDRFIRRRGEGGVLGVVF